MAAQDKHALPVIELRDQRAWERWLSEHHESSAGVWLKIAKKNSGATSITYAQALEIAICHGWIDGQKASHDDSFWLQRFTRRAPRSKWSQINRDRALQLIEQGSMKPSGMAAVQAAQADGRWERAYEPQSRSRIPQDFQLALEQNPRAMGFFETLNAANRYAFLYRLHQAQEPAARAKRIADYIKMLGEGETFHP